MSVPVEGPVNTSQCGPDAEHDQQVREKFAVELAVMLDEHGQGYAAALVRGNPVDGCWP